MQTTVSFLLYRGCGAPGHCLFFAVSTAEGAAAAFGAHPRCAESKMVVMLQSIATIMYGTDLT